ncbi:DsrE family protein [Methylobacterium oryzihabitans]|nr:DsrE family protein [Methylobacterium oryzihabitans]
MSRTAAAFAALALAGTGLAALVSLPAPQAAPRAVAATPRPAESARPAPHRVVIQITQNDPATMTMALNNVENMTRRYESLGEAVEVEIVAYGAGLHMMRADTSPVRERISALARRGDRVVFTGCGNTRAAQSRQEGRDVALVPEARVVEAGITRIVELQEQGWSYVRP